MSKKTTVVVIAFLRSNILRKTLSALSECYDVLDRDIMVFLSSPRNDGEKVKTDAVLAVAKEFQRSSLPNMEIIHRRENLGCSGNIRYAIDHAIVRTGSIIVMEEDMLVSKTWLRFFDVALEFYKNDKRIWCINGSHTPFISLPKNYRHDLFLNPRNNVAGWATWLDRWQDVDFSMSDWPTFKNDAANMRRLVEVGIDISSMLDAVYASKSDAWDAQCSYHLVKNNLFAVEPRYSMVKNLGFMSTDATHCTRPNGYYEKMKIYNFMPQMEPVDALLADYPLLQGKFKYAVSERRFFRFAWRCFMRVVKHFIGPVNNKPFDVE